MSGDYAADIMTGRALERDLRVTYGFEPHHSWWKTPGDIHSRAARLAGLLRSLAKTYNH